MSSASKSLGCQHNVSRCEWVSNDPLYIKYHDEEWGVPIYDDHRLFEMISLEGAQAGLSWITVLRRRDRYREVFKGFDCQTVASLSEGYVDTLLEDSGLIRHRKKLLSVIHNARAVLKIIEDVGSFSEFCWDFVGGEPIINHWSAMAEMPVSTPESMAMSKALKQYGLNFVGPTICYAFMQAVGMVNDHTRQCYLSPE